MKSLTFCIVCSGIFLGLRGESVGEKGEDERLTHSPRKAYNGFGVFEVVPTTEATMRNLKTFSRKLMTIPDVEVYPLPHKLVMNNVVSFVTPPSLRESVKKQLRSLFSRGVAKSGRGKDAESGGVVERDLDDLLRKTNEDEMYQPISENDEFQPIPENEDQGRKSSRQRRSHDNNTDNYGQDSLESENSTTPTPIPVPIVGRWVHLKQLNDWLDKMADENPRRAEIFFAGRSEEGRMLKGLAIGQGDEKCPVIWIHAGIHAREWIAPATSVYLIDRLLKTEDPVVVDILKQIKIYVLPVANPDGYVYSIKCDRLWRKNMKGGSTDYCCRDREYCFTCFGVDLNRNWNMAFNKVGASSWPCDQTFPGGFAFSESETRSIGYTIQVMAPRVKAFLTLHSYGQIWAMPWVHSGEPTEDHEDLLALSKNATELISSVRGSSWTYGQGYFSVYPIGGCSMDWAKRDGIKYSYTVELPPGSNTSFPFGFVRPFTDIIPAGEEVWPGVVLLAETVLKEWKEEERMKEKVKVASED